jgi:hypothetical protein
LRYWRRDGPPLSISKTEDIGRVLHRFGRLKPRTLYGSVNVYSRLETVKDTEEESNIAYASPIWDIDGHVERWRETILVADVIVRRLEAEGVSKSVFVNWSGRGVHVYVHEKAFSKDLLSKHNPLDVAYSVVEHICRLIKQDLVKVSSRLGEQDITPKVENKVDLKRVFTAPLSLHRELDLCAVCLKPDQLGDFDIDWAKPQVLSTMRLGENMWRGKETIWLRRLLGRWGRTGLLCNLGQNHWRNERLYGLPWKQGLLKGEKSGDFR